MWSFQLPQMQLKSNV